MIRFRFFNGMGVANALLWLIFGVTAAVVAVAVTPGPAPAQVYQKPTVMPQLTDLILADSVMGQGLHTYSFAQIQGPVGGAWVADNAALTNAATTTFPNGVLRLDYATGNGAPVAFYSPSADACSLNSGAGDNGSQVQSKDGKCWLLRTTAGGVDFREFGAEAGTDVTAALNAAIAYGFAAGVPIIIPYNPALYTLSSTIEIGNGTASSPSSLNALTLRVEPPTDEYLSGTQAVFQWVGAARGTAFQVNGPIENLHLYGLSVNMLAKGDTGFHITGAFDSDFEWLAVYNYTGPAMIIDTLPANNVHAGNEFNQYRYIKNVVPAIGGSGIQIGATEITGAATSDFAVIDDVFDHLNVQYDCATAGTYGIKLAFATQLTFIHTDSLCANGVDHGSGNSLVISPPTGGTGGAEFPTDISFLHTEFQRAVADPNASSDVWMPLGGSCGIDFIDYSLIYSNAPSSATPSVFCGRTSTGYSIGGAAPLTFAPTIIGSASIGTATYFAQYGSYSIAGGQALVNFSVSISGLSGAAGSVGVGLPVAIKSGSRVGNISQCQIGAFSGITLATNYTSLAGYVPAGGSVIILEQNGSGQNYKPLPLSAINTSATTINGQCEINLQ